MLRQMTWDQLVEWRVYHDEFEPWGEQRKDWRTGMVSATVANAAAAKGHRRFKPSDFMPKFGTASQTKPLTDPEQWRNVLSMAKAGREIVR